MDHFVSGSDLIYDIHARGNLAKDSVLAVQVRVGASG